MTTTAWVAAGIVGTVVLVMALGAAVDRRRRKALKRYLDAHANRRVK